MSNLKAIGPQGLTPEVVYQNFAQEVPKLRAVYIVGLYDDATIATQDGDHTCFYASGDLSGLAFATLAMQEMALNFIRGRIEDV